MWVYQRFVRSRCALPLRPPFSPTPDRKMFGTAFDNAESRVRRTAPSRPPRSLIVDRGLDKDPRLALVARLGHVWEIRPWAYATDVEVKDLSLRMFAAKGPATSRRSPSLRRARDARSRHLVHEAARAADVAGHEDQGCGSWEPGPGSPSTRSTSRPRTGECLVRARGDGRVHTDATPLSGRIPRGSFPPCSARGRGASSRGGPRGPKPRARSTT